MNETEPITNYTDEAVIDMARRVAAGDPINFDRGDLVLLLAELDGRGAAIERVRELCDRLDRSRYATARPLCIRGALDGES